jgi:hypothetical protein
LCWLPNIAADSPAADLRIVSRTRPPVRQSTLHECLTICNDSRMPKLETLDRTAHRNLRVEEETAFAACKDISMCTVGLKEIARLIVEYPVVFTRNGEAGEYVCVALFGCEPSENLFWQDGRWNSVTIPLNIGRLPFDVSIAENPRGSAGQKELVSCIDVENAAVQSERGEPLFDASGADTPYLRHKLAKLAEIIEDERKCREFTAFAARLELIRPFQLELKVQGAQPRKISGLYTIDESKLRALDGATLADLNSRGYLHAMHAMLSSLGQLQILARRGLMQRATNQAQA